jgi:hypothetical protein
LASCHGKDQNNSYNGFDGNKILVPYTAMAQHFPDPRPFIGPGHVDNLIFMPVSAEDHTKAVRQVRQVLGRAMDLSPTTRARFGSGTPSSKHKWSATSMTRWNCF